MTAPPPERKITPEFRQKLVDAGATPEFIAKVSTGERTKLSDTPKIKGQRLWRLTAAAVLMSAPGKRFFPKACEVLHPLDRLELYSRITKTNPELADKLRKALDL